MYLCNLCLLTHYWLHNNVVSDTRILGLHLIKRFWFGSTPVCRIITTLLDYLHNSRTILLFVCEINTKICTSCNLQYHQNFATPVTRGLDRRIPEHLFGHGGQTDWSPLKDISSRDFSLRYKSKNNNKKRLCHRTSKNLSMILKKLSWPFFPFYLQSHPTSSHKPQLQQTLQTAAIVSLPFLRKVFIFYFRFC